MSARINSPDEDLSRKVQPPDGFNGAMHRECELQFAGAQVSEFSAYHRLAKSRSQLALATLKAPPRIARGIFNLGLFFSSFTVLRVGGGGLTAGDCLLAAAFIIAVASRLQGAATYSVRPTTAVIAFLLLIGGLLATVRADSAGGSLAVLFRLFFVILFLPWLSTFLIDDAHRLKRALEWFVAGGAVCGAGTLLQARFGSGAIPGTEITTSGRYTGFTQTVSDTGGITCVVVVLAVGLLLSAGTLRSRFLALACLSGGAIGLILSGSVSGLLAAGIGALVLVLRRALKFRYLVIVAGITLLVIYVTAAIQSATVYALSPTERILQTLGLSQDGRYDTAGSRADTLSAAVSSFIKNPIFGRGLDPSSGIVDGVFPAHNILVAAAFGGGALMLLAMVIALLRAMVPRRAVHYRSQMTTYAFAGAFSALVFAMTAPSPYNRYFWIPLALLLASRAIVGSFEDAPTPALHVEDTNLRTGETTRLTGTLPGVEM